MGEKYYARDCRTTSEPRGRPQETLHERSITPETAHKIRPPAMCVVKASRKGDSHGHTSAPHCFGDFGVSVLLRPGCYRLETSSLSLKRQQGSIGQSARRVRRFWCNRYVVSKRHLSRA